MLRYRKLKERMFLLIIALLTILSLFPLVHIIYSVLKNGADKFFHKLPYFMVNTLSDGGIGPAIVGSLTIVSLSSLIGIPFAFLAGIFMYEYPESFFGKVLGKLLHLMLEIPTILVGVFVMDILVLPMGRYSTVAGAFSLAIIMIPYIATYTYEALNSIPFTYKEAAYSIGLRKFGVIFKIIVPIAKKGIITGFLIGIAKAAGETAPLLFTIGGLYESYPKGIFNSIGAIPPLIYILIQSPSLSDHEIAWGASFFLLLAFLVIFIPIRSMVREVKL